MGKLETRLFQFMAFSWIIGFFYGMLRVYMNPNYSMSTVELIIMCIVTVVIFLLWTRYDERKKKKKPGYCPISGKVCNKITESEVIDWSVRTMLETGQGPTINEDFDIDEEVSKGRDRYG